MLIIMLIIIIMIMIIIIIVEFQMVCVSEHVVFQKPVVDISTGELTKLIGAGKNKYQNLYIFLKTCVLSSKSMF